MAQAMNMILYNIIIVMIIAATGFFVIRRAFRGRYEKRDRYLQEEMEANTARRRDVEEEFYYKPEVSRLPFQHNADGEIEKKQNEVKSMAERKMILFPQKMTNLELKRSYGLANLEIITGYEENYNRYIKALVDWADVLYEHNKKDAVKILEISVEMNSEFRKSYIGLADYYAEHRDAERLNYLLDKVAENFADEGIRRQLTQYIMDRKEGL